MVNQSSYHALPLGAHTHARTTDGREYCGLLLAADERGVALEPLALPPGVRSVVWLPEGTVLSVVTSSDPDYYQQHQRDQQEARAKGVTLAQLHTERQPIPEGATLAPSPEALSPTAGPNPGDAIAMAEDAALSVYEQTRDLYVGEAQKTGAPPTNWRTLHLGVHEATPPAPEGEEGHEDG